jgi:hypothetical protein
MVMRRRFMVVATTAAVVVSCAAAASAATSWAIQATPNPAGSADVSLSAVSCPSTANCTAVGQYTSSAGSMETLAESWDGSTWAIQATPNPSNATVSGLDAVSCGSGTTCTAVGGYNNNTSGDEETLAESWDGSTWAVQAIPSPSGAPDAELDGVSCVSAVRCTAVGWYITSAQSEVPLAERWNGSTWVVRATPSPAGSTGVSLSAVSCTQASSCTAVGGYSSGGTGVPLAEYWNGSTWTIQAIAAPPGATGSSLDAVSCSSATSCTAAGSYVNSSGDQLSLAEYWNGSTWAIQTTVDPSGSTVIILYGVSCASATSCTTSGFRASTSGKKFLTLAEHWNGSTWAIQATPNPAGALDSALHGISCAAPGSCTAAGWYENSSETIESTLAEGK